ncbi:MAG: hypothetical protein EOP54_12085 [Sphingobacteriales bacterium]|nr:MAG: hypothetical protein EOP54_12085 [Sphingobacteriales bacterium]
MKCFIKFSTILLIATSSIFLSCKKDKGTEADNFDPTKYYITGEGTDDYKTSYAIIFQQPAQANFIGKGGIVNNLSNFTYRAGVLYMADESFSFTIVNNKITTSNHPFLTSYHLQKIPDSDAFAGKTFSGTVARNGMNNGVSCQLKFIANGMFTVKIDGFLQTPSTGAGYTLQNNGIATANTGNEGRLHLMSMGDGKLYYSQFNAADNMQYYAILTQQ